MEARTKSEMNEIFTLLRHPYRRYVLYHLIRESETVDFDTLTASLANWDADQPEESQTINSTTIEVQLRHMHLPKLADAGLITFAQDGQSIQLDGINGLSQFIDQAARIDGHAPPAAGD
ncbi:hypothetical protein Halru_1405 [Halovivax ruber XH-70]|uniref:DUF7344 domain-containing protein n=1 Tax=Halovivax ruber (strain DSM 18193 / JCM 13892 / XH-70) TaxID=797302 RepID=L0IDH1_HALRX|nr:hypothetical protein [Halovivax ruber]AGB16017.1 hypothetical protein Halru_1405 [Halovivax ruber XH-70]